MLQELPSAEEPEFELVPLGVTLDEEWEIWSDLEKAKWLFSWVEVRVAKGVRGRKGFDSDRVELVFKDVRIEMIPEGSRWHRAQLAGWSEWLATHP